MNLIATHYDFIRKARPLVSKYATLDVELIRITNPDIETIHSVDDYEGSNFGQCVDEMEDCCNAVTLLVVVGNSIKCDAIF